MAHKLRLPTLLLFVLLSFPGLPAGRVASERAVPAAETPTPDWAQTNLETGIEVHRATAPSLTIASTLPANVAPTGVLAFFFPGEVLARTVAVTVEASYAGPLTNTVAAATEERVTAAYTGTIVAQGADVEVSQQASADPVRQGDLLTYTLAVTNTGDVDLHALIIDILPAHVSPSGVWAWPPATIAPGEVWTRTLAVTVNMGYVGPLTNTVQVTSEEGATATSTEAISIVPEWWLYVPAVMRTFR